MGNHFGQITTAENLKLFSVREEMGSQARPDVRRPFSTRSMEADPGEQARWYQVGRADGAPTA
jgi:hypothetical protein